MKMIFERRLGLLLSIAALTVFGSGLSVQAQTIPSTETPDAAPIVNSATSLEQNNELAIPQNTPLVNQVDSAELENTNQYQQQLNSDSLTPVPGTTETSAGVLTPADSEVAQIDVDPGQVTRGGSSYIGVAGNLGLGGDSALGDGNFMVISKIGLTRILSVRPSVVLGDDPVFLIPVSYDFALRPAGDLVEPLPISPYIGGGIAIETSDDTDLGLLLSAGIDVPFARQFTATAAVNAAFLDETDVGLMVGVGYNFSGLGGL